MKSEIEKIFFVQEYVQQKFGLKIAQSAITTILEKVSEAAFVALNNASQKTKTENRSEVSEADLKISIEEILTGEMISRMGYISREFHDKFYNIDKSASSSLEDPTNDNDNSDKPLTEELYETANMLLGETQLILTNSQEVQLLEDLAGDLKSNVENV